MGGRVRVDMRIFAHCTPLYDDIEWEPKLVSIRRAMGLELPPLPSLGPPILLPCHLPPINPPPAPAPAPPAADDRFLQGSISPEAATCRDTPVGKKRKLPWTMSSEATLLISCSKKAQTKGRGRPKSSDDDDDDVPPSWLESGWRIKRKIRQNGASAGHIDKYYESPEGRIFRSRNEVNTYLRRGKAKVITLN